MQTLFKQLKQLETQDLHQKQKARHQLTDITGDALFATIANTENCIDIQHFGEAHLTQLQTHFPLKHDMASHDVRP
ncbi:MAG: transposase family protein [Candidatus Bathyarchaeota archaeon]|nr:transposase family protein [Candidatus Termiticorpusculum sp.]